MQQLKWASKNSQTKNNVIWNVEMFEMTFVDFKLSSNRPAAVLQREANTTQTKSQKKEMYSRPEIVLCWLFSTLISIFLFHRECELIGKWDKEYHIAVG